MNEYEYPQVLPGPGEATESDLADVVADLAQVVERLCYTLERALLSERLANVLRDCDLEG